MTEASWFTMQHTHTHTHAHTHTHSLYLSRDDLFCDIFVSLCGFLHSAVSEPDYIY